jgi:phosphoenolpyruvate carboxykinase (GTP)
MGSETTAAATGKVGQVRRDPFAMLPFCGYHIADYFDHWLKVGRSVPVPPRIFAVNWFRRDANGKFLWPGYGENMRVLQWIVDRCNGRAAAAESVLGWMPRSSDLEWSGLHPSIRERYGDLMSIHRDQWLEELVQHEALFVKMYDKLPRELILKRELLLASISRSPAQWTLQD